MTRISPLSRPRTTTAALLVAFCAGVGPTLSQAQSVAEPAAVEPAVLQSAETAPAASPKARSGQYDYTQVLTIFKDSIGPVRSEMGSALSGFGLAMQDANRQMDQGDFEAAIVTSLEAIDGMLALRDQIVDPLLDGQEGMVKEIGPLREALARALSESPAEQGRGLAALDDRTRGELIQLARQYRDATTDNARRLAEQKFRTKFRLAELKQRARGSEERVNEARRRLLERLDQMLAVLGELSVNAEITFTTLGAQSELFHQYRESLQLARTAQEAEAALNEIFGGLGFGGALTEIEGLLEQFGTDIDDKLVAVLDSLADTNSRSYGSSQDADMTELMTQLLQQESE